MLVGAVVVVGTTVEAGGAVVVGTTVETGGAVAEVGAVPVPVGFTPLRKITILTGMNSAVITKMGVSKLMRPNSRGVGLLLWGKHG